MRSAVFGEIRKTILVLFFVLLQFLCSPWGLLCNYRMLGKNPIRSLQSAQYTNMFLCTVPCIPLQEERGAEKGGAPGAGDWLANIFSYGNKVN